jgi:LPS export ABC transporter protein LptC
MDSKNHPTPNPPSNPTKTSASRWRYWTRFHLPNVIYLLLLLALAGGSYWWIKQNKAPVKAAPEKHPELIDAFVQELTLNRTNKDGSIGFVITGGSLAHYGSKDGNLQTVTLEATPIGQPKVTATGATGGWTDDSHTIVLSGDVKLTRAAFDDAAEMVLTTDAVEVNLYDGKAHTELPFKVTQGKSFMTGAGFIYDYQTRDLMLNGTKKQRIHALIYGVAAKTKE